MQIHIIEDPTVPELTLTIRTPRHDAILTDLLAAINLVGNTVAGMLGDETHFIPLGDVLYFEAVDDRTFFYTARETYETPSRLHTVEEKLAATPFVRISRSTVVNLRQVKCMKREKNARLLVTLTNGEALIVSRQYMPTIRERLEVLL